MVALSNHSVQLGVGLIDVCHSLVDGFIQTLDSLAKGALLLIENLDAKLLVLAFLFLLSEIVFSVEVGLLLSLPDIMAEGSVLM